MDDKKKKEDYGEEEILVTDAQPAKPDNGAPIPAGHHRFYCEKCHTVRS